MRKVVLVAIVLLASVSMAQAAAIVPFNNRTSPVINAPWDPNATVPFPWTPGSVEPNLNVLVGNIFATAYTMSDIRTAPLLQSAGMWAAIGTLTPGNNTLSVIPTLSFEFTSGAPNQTLGIWSGTYFNSWAPGDNDIVMKQLFSGSDVGAEVQPGIPATHTLKWALDGTLYVDNVSSGLKVNPFSFGFYLTTGQNTFFTVDQLNGGAARAMAFKRPSDNTWAIGFEDGSDMDYQDAVLKVESVTAVPEPGSMLLLGTGLFGLAGAIRRRIKK